MNMTDVIITKEWLQDNYFDEEYIIFLEKIGVIDLPAEEFTKKLAESGRIKDAVLIYLFYIRVYEEDAMPPYDTI